MRGLLGGIVALVIATSVDCNKCSSTITQKYEEKFQDMNYGDLLVETKYRQRKNPFQVIRVWNDDGVSTDLNDRIDVHFENSFSNELSNGRYLIVVRRDGAAFSSALPPLQLKKSCRHNIRDKWCSASPHDCKLSISRIHFPPLIIFDRRQIIIVECHVSSRHAITSIRWKKDGLDIQEKEGSTYPIYPTNDIYVKDVNLVDGISELVIASASSMHSGVYSCVATDSSDAEVEMKSRITLRGDRSAFNTCPAGKESYCMSGTCYGINGLPGQLACLCPPGFKDERCQSMDVLHPGLPSIDPQEDVEKLEHTVVILSIVAILTGICLILALISLYRLRRRRRNSNDYEAPTENEKTTDTDVETASENLQNV